MMRDKQTAVDIWMDLMSRYNSKTEELKTAAIDRVFDWMFDPKISVYDNMAEFEHRNQRMKDLGLGTFGDQTILWQFIHTLPESFGATKDMMLVQKGLTKVEVLL